MDLMKISVILCTQAASRHLEALISSLAVQDFPAQEYEVLIVDNSPDGAAKDLAGEAVQAAPDRKIRYVHEPVPGKTRALNAGVKIAQGEIVAFLDDDVSLDSDWLVAIAHAFDNPGTGGAGGKITPQWPGKAPGWFTPAVAGFTPVHDFGDKPLAYHAVGACPVGANMAFRKLAVEQAGLFDVNLGHCGEAKLGGEEWDLCRRVRRIGYRLMYEPQAGVKHHFTRDEAIKSYWRGRAFTQGRVAAYILFKDDAPLLNRAKAESEGAALHRNQPGKNLFYFQLKAAFAAGFACGLVFGLPKK
ncbi:glycosyl transferase family 2 [Desulfatibacillum aliphaticivorans]|uniref:Glycosyl transferase family 2 n=1 Tax=Desulfatibacillum aliphaticivorans TaxID=218208 RepID=B8FE93_DESAL|nr:glycosyltransferase [Desulfatibacillum aliphaticivorans]ACL06874.1 glycosyl transferase family 2 [Desulfatibacillum aliphaticivorans]